MRSGHGSRVGRWEERARVGCRGFWLRGPGRCCAERAIGRTAGQRMRPRCGFAFEPWSIRSNWYHGGNRSARLDSGREWAGSVFSRPRPHPALRHPARGANASIAASTSSLRPNCPIWCSFLNFTIPTTVSALKGGSTFGCLTPAPRPQWHYRELAARRYHGRGEILSSPSARTAAVNWSRRSRMWPRRTGARRPRSAFL